MEIIENYIQLWRNKIIKECNESDYQNEDSNTDVLIQFKLLGENPIITKDNEGNPIYMDYDEQKNVLTADVNGKKVEYKYKKFLKFEDNLNNFEE